MSTMINSVRPGILLGEHPERNEQNHASALDLRLSQWFGIFNTKPPSMSGFQILLDRIQTAEQSLSNSNCKVYSEDLEQLRLQLKKKGLIDANLVKLFAMIRTAVHQILGLYPHPEQLFAAWSMLQGSIAEMNTGEGKTLTAAFPAIAMALTGTPVHVITVNEYLVQRDADKLKNLYAHFGLRIGVVTDSMSDVDRRYAYTADIVYCTNKQIVFDYLRDQRAAGSERSSLKYQIRSLLSTSPVEPLMRGLCFAIVDEADSVMIDDARTPLILAESRHSEPTTATEASIALGIARTLHEGVDFRLQQDGHLVGLTNTGLDSVRSLADSLSGAWRFERYRNELIRQALCALHLFKLNRDYIVRDGCVELVDASTGRAMPERKLQHGLHRILEVKEKCEISPTNEVIAGISFQRFFQRYVHLCGMSGTVHEVRSELHQVYGINVVRIPPHKPVIRKNLETKVFCERESQLEWAVEDVLARHVARQPVLIGTRTVELSEKISAMLNEREIPHEVLNARQSALEANIIARAGRPEGVTVATNMAGRGTDISLQGNATKLGGLHVISLEINESSRVDRQLFGRSARQGDPGSSQAILSLTDELVLHSVPAVCINLIKYTMNKFPGIGHWLALKGIRYAQSRHENACTRQRIAVYRGHEHLQRQLAISGDMD